MTLLFDLGTSLSDLRGVSCGLFDEIRLTVRVRCSAGGVGRCSVGSTAVSNSISIVGVVAKSIITGSTISRGVISISSGTISVYFLLTTIGS